MNGDTLEPGQRKLSDDLKDLLKEVEEGQFGDFSNSTRTFPKMELCERFEDLIKNTKDGKYD